MSTPTRALTLRVIELACRAPSVHNSQPWRWRVVDDATIELYADRRRQLQVSDPSGRNLALSCGAAIHHGFVAAQALGLTAAVDLMPLSDDENLLARISLSSGTRTDEALESLQALEERCTDRRRFTSWPVPDSRLAHLAKAASGWGAHAIPITDVTARFRAEQLLKRAMAVQAIGSAVRRGATRGGPSTAGRTGMPLANAAPPATRSSADTSQPVRVRERCGGHRGCRRRPGGRELRRPGRHLLRGRRPAVVAEGGRGTQRAVAAGHPRRVSRSCH